MVDDREKYGVPSLPSRKPETEEERRARQADFFRRLKSIPDPPSWFDPNYDREAFRKSLKESLEHDVQLYKDALPPYIFAEHSTGESPLVDAFSLEDAYLQELERKKQQK